DDSFEELSEDITIRDPNTGDDLTDEPDSQPLDGDGALGDGDTDAGSEGQQEDAGLNIDDANATDGSDDEEGVWGSGDEDWEDIAAELESNGEGDDTADVDSLGLGSGEEDE
ncbi:MAG: hypothetical protein ABEH90_02280, partial [Halolamina sp.]